MKYKMALAILALMLAVSSVQAQKQKNISESQCRNIFPSADDYQNRRTADGTPYCEVYWDRDDDPRVLLGYVFLKTLTLPDKATELLIGVDTNGKIVKVHTKEPTAAIGEFLAQFEGKSMNTSFEVAKTAEELLYLPSKIKALKDNLAMSESIAKTVHEVMLSANNSLALVSVK
jgi:transcriptional regulator of nitric oxide reductase